LKAATFALRVFGLLALPLTAGAQVAPSPAEIATWRGLHAAAQRGDGATIDHANNLHSTTAIESIVLGAGDRRRQAMPAALRGEGASTSLADRSGRTPLQLARDCGHRAMVRTLEAAGAR
jgi:uncharacterized protein